MEVVRLRNAIIGQVIAKTINSVKKEAKILVANKTTMAAMKKIERRDAILKTKGIL